jgi:hypothetical protein
VIQKLAFLTAVLLASTAASADRPGLNLTEEQNCYGVPGYNALIARIETERGHNSAATICYVDSDGSGLAYPYQEAFSKCWSSGQRPYCRNYVWPSESK